MTNWQPEEEVGAKPGDVTRVDWIKRVYVDVDAREPEIPVGTAGTATVRGVEGVRVTRGTSGACLYWRSGRSVKTCLVHEDEHVTDFVPDEILTAKRAEQIRAEERERIADSFEQYGWIQSSGSAIAQYIRDGAQ